ncbi:SAM-dependent DNA methyltransferase [Hymenobacter gummosus]|uniref:site-specific DNA-methyltransferase (adenine-specific) n=1 Tax=Hymenobacter gummosus TaxID=1776032 RepID=A0A431TYW7_9BACT|nr:class I SAM-dependent DNA methyltransferase [Hymenobacter gummosus]RTQ47505.1 SAM-dependent DNA methyltransferase [Hymenobacter gummosus]
MPQLDLDTLESWLWDSANILRGSIDSSDFKNYIFGLLFLKRVNDVFEEEVDKLMQEEGYSRAEAEDATYLKVPAEARWEALKKVTENIGVALDKAFAAIEYQNTELKLEGVLTATKFGDKEKLSDETLQRLLRHFNLHSLRNEDLYTPDLLGDAYEYLIKQFADDAGKKGGEFYTPRGVVRLIVGLIRPQPGNSVYDPTCGSGGMLIEAARYIDEHSKDRKTKFVNVQLAGQEKNLGTWAIAKLNMLLHNYSADLRKGDTLTDPRHLTGDKELMLFDRVIANPPFSQDRWWTPAETNPTKKLGRNGKETEVVPNYASVVADPFGRLLYGTPPRSYADLAFLQHMLAVLRQEGRMGVVLPHGTLFRGGAEGTIREKLLQADLVEGIVGLPSALFYNTGIPAAIWVLTKTKAPERRGNVLVLDASQEFKAGKNQNELEETHVQRILAAYEAGQDVDKYLRVVPLSEIKANDYNLNISRYIDRSEAAAAIDLAAVHVALRELEAKEAEIDEKLERLLEEIGL